MADPPGADQTAWDETYDDNTYVVLALVLDGKSVKLQAKVKAEEEAWFWAKKEGSSYLFDFGLGDGDEEYDENKVPPMLKKLIGSRGGGPGGNSFKLPVHLLVDPAHPYRRRTFADYSSLWGSRGRRPDEYMAQGLFLQLANLYLRRLGVPAYL